MITDQDVKKLEKTFVTNKSLKKELDKFVTKDEFAGHTKRLDSIEEKLDGLIYEVGDIKVEVAELGEKFEAMEDRFGAKLDRFLQNMHDQRLDSAAGAVILARHERQILALAEHMDVILPG